MMEKDKILKSLDQAIEKQVPDVWNEITSKIQSAEESGKGHQVVMLNHSRTPKKKKFYVRFTLAAAVCLLAIFTLTFTPALASIQGVIDQIFNSNHIDDTGLKKAINKGLGENIGLTYYDKKHDITVHYQSVMTDDKETKLLLTYKSKNTNLKNYYLDIFEGKTSVNLIVNGHKKKLDNVGWGSRYYDKQTNKVVEALSFESLKQYKGQKVNLEIDNVTIYKGQIASVVPTAWPLSFKLDPSAVSDREAVAVNKTFQFEGATYHIKRVEFSALETRVVVTGSDTKLLTDPTDGTKYKIMSKLEHEFLNERKVSKDTGYTVDYNKSGVFLLSEGKKVGPIYSKGEVKGEPDEFLMIFDPVKNHHDLLLLVGDNLKIPLTK
jgi:hypothetical protein